MGKLVRCLCLGACGRQIWTTSFSPETGFGSFMLEEKRDIAPLELKQIIQILQSILVGWRGSFGYEVLGRFQIWFCRPTGDNTRT